MTYTKAFSARICLREPIPEIADAARFLDAAVSAHLLGQTKLTEELVRLANMPAIRAWTESLWGSKSPYVKAQPRSRSLPPPPASDRHVKRMPARREQLQLLQRDGYHCRFCGIPVIRSEIRQRFDQLYPHLAIWGRKNDQQHAAFQAMWVQYDHIVPHALGGANDMANLVITCAPCNFGRMNFTLDEQNLVDPRTREPLRSLWDDLSGCGSLILMRLVSAGGIPL